jgi:uncharacterized protein (DUF488 family)
LKKSAHGRGEKAVTAGESTRGETDARGIVADVKSAAERRVYTLGYQGRTLREVLETVQRYGIEQVLDVRENASSKKPGFAGVDLEPAFARLGVAYSHLPELGCASASRHALWRGESREPFLNDYRRRLAERPEAFANLVHRVRSARSLLLCLERDPSRCHRAVLSERLQAEGIATQDL